tara:strand:- start:112 stop:333 length:222 start_codon:yes stop_codon:yes gene_type:complete
MLSSKYRVRILHYKETEPKTNKCPKHSREKFQDGSSAKGVCIFKVLKKGVAIDQLEPVFVRTNPSKRKEQGSS